MSIWNVIYMARAYKHGATYCTEGINWDTAEGFPTERAALAFIQDPDCVNMQARGIYAAKNGTFAVRYRQGDFR